MYSMLKSGLTAVFVPGALAQLSSYGSDTEGAIKPILVLHGSNLASPQERDVFLQMDGEQAPSLSMNLMAPSATRSDPPIKTTVVVDGETITIHAQTEWAVEEVIPKIKDFVCNNEDAILFPILCHIGDETKSTGGHRGSHGGVSSYPSSPSKKLPPWLPTASSKHRELRPTRTKSRGKARPTSSIASTGSAPRSASYITNMDRPPFPKTSLIGKNSMTTVATSKTVQWPAPLPTGSTRRHRLGRASRLTPSGWYHNSSTIATQSEYYTNTTVTSSATATSTKSRHRAGRPGKPREKTKSRLPSQSTSISTRRFLGIPHETASSSGPAKSGISPPHTSTSGTHSGSEHHTAAPSSKTRLQWPIHNTEMRRPSHKHSSFSLHKSNTTKSEVPFHKKIDQPSHRPAETLPGHIRPTFKPHPTSVANITSNTGKGNTTSMMTSTKAHYTNLPKPPSLPSFCPISPTSQSVAKGEQVSETRSNFGDWRPTGSKSHAPSLSTPLPGTRTKHAKPRPTPSKPTTMKTVDKPTKSKGRRPSSQKPDREFLATVTRSKFPGVPQKTASMAQWPKVLTGLWTLDPIKTSIYSAQNISTDQAKVTPVLTSLPEPELEPEPDSLVKGKSDADDGPKTSASHDIDELVPWKSESAVNKVAERVENLWASLVA